VIARDREIGKAKPTTDLHGLTLIEKIGRLGDRAGPRPDEPTTGSPGARDREIAPRRRFFSSLE